MGEEPRISGSTSAGFRERLRVPIRWWLQGGMLVATFWVAMVVAIPEAAAWGIAAAFMALLAAALWSYGGARIVVEDGWLYAGQAKIKVNFIGDVLTLDKHATREWSGPLADARAFLLLRPYLPLSVRIGIADADDPTPYWLVSTRRPGLLVAALNQTRQSTAARKAVVPSAEREAGPTQP